MYDKFTEFIKDKQHICVVQAENPDGDSLGSALALEEALADKEVSLYCPVDIPKYMRYFEGWGRVDIEFAYKADAIIIVDTASTTLLSKLLNDGAIRNCLYSTPVLVIDHHETEADLEFPYESIIEPTSSCCALLYKIFKDQNIAVNAQCAEDIIYGILSDTLGLTSPSTSSDDYRAVAELLDDGANIAEMEERRREFSKKSPRILDYKADLIKRVEYHLDGKLAQLKNIYKLYQAETTANTAKISPRDLVNFLLAHQNDDKLKGALTSETLARLSLAQYIMNHQDTKFTYAELAKQFNLDDEKVKLVYALYEYRYINTNPQLSLRTLIDFINNKILPNENYASRLSANERTQIRTIAQLMHAAAAGTPYNYEALYRAILPLANNVDKNQLFLAYLYHGSLYDYDENWTLTVEKFINYLSDKILPDARFAARIDDEMRTKIQDGRDTVNDAKKLLVGPVHYRALVETNLPAEGEQTFSLISELKSKLGPKNKTDYYVMGDSAMAYEMSQTFGGEMDFITVITMLAIFAVVVCTFKSFFVSLLLVLVIQCAVYIVMAYLSLTGSSIFFIALIIVQAILMGATIDYAILFTTYYVENRSYYKLGIKDALINTYNRSIGAILTSASILIIVTAIVGNLATAIAAMVCSAISLGTFCATVIILVLLPALLATLDRFIIKAPRTKNAVSQKGLKKVLESIKTIL